METEIRNGNDEKKAYLRRYGDDLRAERKIEEEITQLRLDTMMPAVANDGMPHGSGGCGDLSGYAAQVDALLNDLKEQIEKRIKIRREIIERIETMQNESEKTVLMLRYIHLLKWTDIANKMRIGERYAKRVHGRALVSFTIVEGEHVR